MERPDRHHLNQEIKFNLTKNETNQPPMPPGEILYEVHSFIYLAFLHNISNLI